MLIRLSDSARLFHADCRDAIKSLPDNSIDSCVTDPPYALVSIVKRFGGPNAQPAKGNDAYMRASAGFMSARWDVGDVAFAMEFWSEVLRVLKPGGHLAAFGGTRTQHRLVCAIEDAGFEIRDQLYWHYGSGFPKSQNVAKFIDKELGVSGSLGDYKSVDHAAIRKPGSERMNEGWQRPWMEDEEKRADYGKEYIPGSPEAQRFNGYGTALKPATEPICLARKPLSEGTVAANVLRWGTGALNIDGCRVAAPEGKTAGGRGASKGAVGWQPSAGFDIADGLGRWPANCVHDGSDEVVGAFPYTTSGSIKPYTRSTTPNVYALGMAKEGRHVTSVHAGDSGSAARFFKSCPPDETDRRFFYSAKASRQDRNGSKHPTVKPIALMQWLARLITPPGGTILDPFAGSGTTGEAARREGFSCVLCEREDEYVEDIRRRLGAAGSDPLARLLRWNAAVTAYRAAHV